MSRDLKYPVKYALLELKENSGWLGGYEDVTQGFIVSKCYLVEGSVRFFSSGKHELLYKVVFPFKNNPHYELSIQNIDQNMCSSISDNGGCYLVDLVYDIFDNYEEASLLAEQKNKELKAKLILKVSVLDPNWKVHFKNLKDEFHKKLAVCQEIEKMIAFKTRDMNVSRERFDVYAEETKKQVVARRVRTSIK